ncbi:unnamed protein product [Pieris macdunnoughi]|uniref:Uncharacterized protein n=1 Tax=Pieris macdunnoughi TaxID=345717 RepID=A0A821L420_9NEOP|nr:unnamed protein product [Pieris macdunnoughi]
MYLKIPTNDLSFDLTLHTEVKTRYKSKTLSKQEANFYVSATCKVQGYPEIHVSRRERRGHGACVVRATCAVFSSWSATETCVSTRAFPKRHTVATVKLNEEAASQN